MSYVLRQLDRSIDQLEDEIGRLLTLLETVEDNKADLDSRLQDACRERAETIAWRVRIAREMNQTERLAEQTLPAFDGTGYLDDIVGAPV